MNGSAEGVEARIIVGVDGSEGSRHALGWAAAARQAGLTVTSAAPQAVDQIGSPSGLGGGDWAR